MRPLVFVKNNKNKTPPGLKSPALPLLSSSLVLPLPDVSFTFYSAMYISIHSYVFISSNLIISTL